MKIEKTILALAMLLCPWGLSLTVAQSTDQQSLALLQQELAEQKQQIRALQEQLNAEQGPWGLFEEKAKTETAASAGDPSDANGNLRVRFPLGAEEPYQLAGDGSDNVKGFQIQNYFVDYDKGFVIRPYDAKKHPFELRIGGWIQFRHHAFSRDSDSWTDNAGVTRPIYNRSAFDVERGRLVFSGFALDKRLTYFLQMDGDTDGLHTVDFFDYFWGWQLTDRFQVQVGKRKVPGSRQWLLTARRTRFSDRPMANDFFRPDRTVGVFGVGDFGANGHYQLMWGNGFQTTNLANSLTDTLMTFAASSYVDPWGDFGSNLVDFEGCSDPLVRLGHSFAYSPQKSNTLGSPLDETSFVRLADGTRLTQTGALAPGVTVSQYDLVFYGLDASYKGYGWSVNSEVFCRWINDIQGDGPLADDSLQQFGYYVEGGYFLIPKVFDLNLRHSQVNGDYGSASEFAIGCNWFPLKKQQMKVSFEVTQLDGSPLQNTSTDILVGDNGALFRTQVQLEF